jgi:hypothetical protein
MKLDGKTEQRVHMTFLVKLKDRAAETFSFLREVHEEDTASKTDENVEKVRTFVRTGPRLGTRMTAGVLNMYKETVRQILTRKKCNPKWAQRIHQFLATKQIPALPHTPYSPDLGPCDLFFQNWKFH